MLRFNISTTRGSVSLPGGRTSIWWVMVRMVVNGGHGENGSIWWSWWRGEIEMKFVKV